MQILAKNGLYVLLNNLGVKVKGRKLLKDDVPLPVRIKNTLEELGPTFIKLGQMISLRTDLIPEDIANELAKLQDSAMPFDFNDAKKTFESELGYKFEDVFEWFGENPIASASIGQVYVARLKSTGEKVVVKIQRPNLDTMIESDMSILAEIARLLDERIKNRPVSFAEVVLELSTALKRELDYTLEARNAQKFRNLYKSSFYGSHVVIPKVYWEYTTKKVLTMEFIEGISVKDVEQIKRRHWDVKKIARIGANSFLEQVIDFGFFHGDPHPGNIMALSSDKIAYIDFGTVGKMDRIQRKFLYNLFDGFAKNDLDFMVEEFEEMGCIGPKTDILSLKRDLRDIVDFYYGASIKDVNVKDMVNHLMRIIYKNKIVLPPDFTMLFKALITIEGVGKVLDPDFNISTLIRDYSVRKFKRELNILEHIDESIPEMKKLLRLTYKFPYIVYDLLKKWDRGDISVEIRYSDVDKMRSDIKSSANRLSLSIIASALIIGSSFALQLKTGPRLWGMPLLGIVGYFIAVVIGLWLIGSIIVSSWLKK